MRAQKSYIDASSTQVTAPGIFWGFSFRDLEKLKGGDSWIHSKEHSKTEFRKKKLEQKFWESETFYRSNLVLRPARQQQQITLLNQEIACYWGRFVWRMF